MIRGVLREFFKLATLEMHGAPGWFKKLVVIITILFLLMLLGSHGYPWLA